MKERLSIITYISSTDIWLVVLRFFNFLVVLGFFSLFKLIQTKSYLKRFISYFRIDFILFGIYLTNIFSIVSGYNIGLEKS
jgi:hypothetical protein